MRWRARPTAANHSHEWTNRFSTGMEIQQIKQNRAIFVWMKKNKDFIKVRRKQSYNKHLISRLTSQYGWVFLIVELYFGLPKGSPKYCWLILYYITLHYITLYYIILYYIILYYTILYYTILYYIILYYIILYYIILYYIILYCIVLYCIVLYCIVLYCIILYYIILRVPYTFSVTRDWEFYFSVIRDSWYKFILRPREFEFWLFREREILFWISRDAWKGQIILRDSVIRKGIGDPLYYVMLCYVMLCYVMLCYVMLCYVMLCYVMLCYVMLCYVMLCYVMLCYVMLCYVMLCYVWSSLGDLERIFKRGKVNRMQQTLPLSEQVPLLGSAFELAIAH